MITEISSHSVKSSVDTQDWVKFFQANSSDSQFFTEHWQKKVNKNKKNVNCSIENRETGKFQVKIVSNSSNASIKAVGVVFYKFSWLKVWKTTASKQKQTTLKCCKVTDVWVSRKIEFLKKDTISGKFQVFFWYWLNDFDLLVEDLERYIFRPFYAS